MQLHRELYVLSRYIFDLGPEKFFQERILFWEGNYFSMQREESNIYIYIFFFCHTSYFLKEDDPSLTVKEESVPNKNLLTRTVLVQRILVLVWNSLNINFYFLFIFSNYSKIKLLPYCNSPLNYYNNANTPFQTILRVLSKWFWINLLS